MKVWQKSYVKFHFGGMTLTSRLDLPVTSRWPWSSTAQFLLVQFWPLSLCYATGAWTGLNSYRSNWQVTPPSPPLGRAKAIVRHVGSREEFLLTLAHSECVKSLDGFPLLHALVFQVTRTNMKSFYMFLKKLELEGLKIYKFSSLYDYFYVNRARPLCIIFFQHVRII